MAAAGEATARCKQDDIDGARAAYQRAVDCERSDLAMTAALELGELLAAHGDIADATALLRKAMYAGDGYSAPLAAIKLGTVLQEAGDFQAARRRSSVLSGSGRQRSSAKPASDFGTCPNLVDQAAADDLIAPAKIPSAA